MARRIDLSAHKWLTLAMGASMMALLSMSSGCGAEDDFAESTLDSAEVGQPLGTEVSLWSDADVPAILADSDTAAVEIGVKFRSSVAGQVTGIRFYKGAGNTGTHVGHLWNATGQQLASVTFPNESASGWQVAHFNAPVTIGANQVYVVSYHAPNGHYSANNNYFSSAGRTNGALYALKDGESGGNGVYRYGTSGFPTSTWQGSNYWVDVLFVSASDATPPTVAISSPAANATLVGTAQVTGTASDNVGLSKVEIQVDAGSFITATGTSNWTYSLNTVALTNGSHTLTVRATDTTGNTTNVSRTVTVNNPISGGGSLNLPRVSWEGGPSYYSAYSYTDAAAWDNPTFFPIGVWFEGVYSQSDINLDKDAGLNTYVELTSGSNMPLIKQNGMFAIAGVSGKSSETIGHMLTDEPDMWAGPGSAAWTGNYPGEGDICNPSNASCGYSVMQTLVNATPSDGRVRYANYGKGVMLWQSDSEAQQFVNAYTHVVSNDIYWYTDPNICGEMQTFLGLPSATCRLAANYGVTMDRMRLLDAMDGQRQPIWAFIEVGHPFTEDSAPSITANQIAGAVMSSLIHEARGIIYFNHSFGGPCESQHALRESCYATQRAKVKETNLRIKDLAPVLNTQSYVYSFNGNLDTMLKEHNGSYYIFAMLGRAKPTGSYTLTLPPGLAGSTVQVLYENRTLAINGGAFTDSFAAEYAYHIYKITP
ncbi:DUF4082 domain-containing protein [Polyangium aurulentum]|uniref:DUF4082 domain-containing protein n=1 Tax=Polyangium aurulentum TaxID=2567896 RepID=UPI0010AEB1A5|nr:DUF4082 domain-containing protein [Polyangium aurulentum]UQA61816.1 DUF4082 domain-containing protein [Polyangium aurulentum]